MNAESIEVVTGDSLVARFNDAAEASEYVQRVRHRGAVVYVADDSPAGYRVIGNPERMTFEELIHEIRKGKESDMATRKLADPQKVLREGNELDKLVSKLKSHASALATRNAEDWDEHPGELLDALLKFTGTVLESQLAHTQAQVQRERARLSALQVGTEKAAQAAAEHAECLAQIEAMRAELNESQQLAKLFDVIQKAEIRAESTEALLDVATARRQAIVLAREGQQSG